jgi:predicted Zn finger-like uncharacterized protein
VQVVCEHCTTAYDFPESNVPPGGVTVKCAGCGHRFRVVRVRRKTIPVMVPPAAGPLPPGEGPWQVRTARGEVFPLPDVALLRGWILERKVTRDDELANAAGLWRKLGSIPEYAGAFVEVDRAIATQRMTPQIRTLDEFTAETGARKRAQTIELKVPIGGFKSPPSGPPPLGPPPAAQARARPAPAQPLEEDALEAQPVRVLRPLLIAGAILLVGVAVAATRFWMQRGPSEAYRKARELLLADTDDDLRRAEAAFRAISGREELLAKAGLAEVWATRGHYKLLEADELERAGKTPAAAERRREALADADQARRAAEEASASGKAVAEANRALADALRVGGGPAAQIEQLLARARTAAPDPESLYVEGALRLRDGKRVIALNLLDEATRRFEAATGAPLLRADYLLATIYLADGKKDEAKARLRRILVARPGHGRAEHLLELVDAGASTAPAPPEKNAPARGPVPPPDATAPPAATPGPGASSGGGPIDKAIRNDYGALVAEADRVAEKGSGTRAATLYQRALAIQPRGVEALTGLGYCYTDDEKYALALATFKRALAVNPQHGEAVIGMAEAYRMKGNAKQALEFYRRYLAEHPDGPKASMAQSNVRDLEWKYGGARPAPPPAPAPEQPPPAPAPEQPAPTTP